MLVISSNNLCVQECDDVSDEKNFRIVYTDPEKYLKSKSPHSESKKLPIYLRLVYLCLIVAKNPLKITLGIPQMVSFLKANSK